MIEKIMRQKAADMNANTQNIGKEKDIERTSQDFESIFIYYLLSTMRKGVVKSDLMGNGRGEEVYRSMLDEELSKNMAQAGGIGLKDMLVRDLKSQINGGGEDMRLHGNVKRLQETMHVEKPAYGKLKAVDSTGGDNSTFKLPLNNAVSSGYGVRKDPVTGEHKFHFGIDIDASEGTPVYPCTDGTVIFSGEKPGYGNVVEIKHDNGYVSRYAHNQKNLVRQGQKISESDIIALVGSSGKAGQPHLHFEIRVEGFAVNPMDIVSMA